MTEKNSIIAFQRYLRLQKGLSPNTLDAYMHDIGKLTEFCLTKNIRPEELQLKDLEEFSASLHDLGIALSSHAISLSLHREALMHFSGSFILPAYA